MSAADLTGQEGIDLLNKLITESKRVEVFVVSASGLTCSMRGMPRIGPDGRVWLGGGVGEPHLAFAPSAAVAARYGDERLAEKFPDFADRFREHFVSALMFRFSDNSVVGLFELADS